MMANPAFAEARPCSPDALTAVELTWLEKRVEHWIRFGRDVAETIIDRRRRVLSFAPNTIFAFVRWASNDLRHRRLAHRHRARDRAGRGLSDAALRPSRRRDPAAHQRLAQGRACVRRRSTPSRPSASIRPTPRPITGGMSTIASAPDTNRVRIAATSIAPGSCGGGCCHDALRLRHDDVFRLARHRRISALPSAAAVHLERQRQRADRPLRRASGRRAARH